MPPPAMTQLKPGRGDRVHHWIDLGGAAKLGGEHDERLLQQAAGLEILEQGAEGGIELIGRARARG
jgi:hypothetical protein